MARRQARELAGELIRAAERLTTRRAGRERGARIPAELSQEAVELAEQHGVSRVATVLRLDYYELAKRCQRGGEEPARAKRTAATAADFVQLPIPEADARNSQFCELEVGPVRGTWVRFRFPLGEAERMAALARVLCEGR